MNDSFDYMRGKTSISLVDMTIHRPDWERTVTIKAWTKGRTESVFHILAPPKDRGNGTLKKGREMWMYNPKINRVIKLPPSMMAQSWMGSDFSNNDLAKTDSIVEDYVHTIAGTETHDGRKVYVIDSVPKPAAPVVWGMLRFKVREDHIVLREEFYDEDKELVKVLRFLEITPVDGKLYPTSWRMEKADARDEYTLITYKELAFDRPLPSTVFTLSFLKHPQR